MEAIKKTMNERNLSEGQWEDRKQWSLGVGQRRKTFWTRYIHTCRKWRALYTTCFSMTGRACSPPLLLMYIHIICVRAVKVFACVTHSVTHRFSHENWSRKLFNFALLYVKSLSQLQQKSHQTASVSFVTAECDVITNHVLHFFRRS